MFAFKDLFSVFIFGFLQFYSVVFISKYFEYVYHPFYSLLILFSIQILSLWTNLWQSQLTRFRYYLYPLYFVSLLFLSRTSVDSSIYLVVLGCIVMFSLVQSEIISLFKAHKENLRHFYAAEISGGILGTGCWYFFSVPLGFVGFFYLCFFALSLGLFLKNKEVRKSAAVILFGAVVCLWAQEPQPILNKRERLEILKTAHVEISKWDPNGHVELISPDETSDKILSFEGGALRSHIYKFDGDYDKLRSDYLNSVPTGAWGLDVILPHFMQYGANPNTVLISAMGGQEILAARAFDARHIYAVDINGSGQDIVAIDNASFGGHIYSPPVQRITQDGRFFVEHSTEQFDVIQIYSAESASFSSALGSFFRPSSLITAEAIATYDRHLTDHGILQITLPLFLKLKSTFEAALGDQIFTESKNVFAYYRADRPRDLVSIVYKKNAWSPEEVIKMTTWLEKDPLNKWSTLINPNDSIQKRKQILASLTTDDTFLKPSTDNWPFFKLSRPPLAIDFIHYLIAALVLVTFVFAGSSLQKTVRFSVNLNSFLMGSTYAIAQSLLIYHSQKLLGQPALGLCFAIVLILLLTALSALSKVTFLERFLSNIFVFIGLIFSLIGAGYFMNLIWVIALSALVFRQGIDFIQLLKNNSARAINFILWTNGLGFAFGIVLFNLVFVFFGLFQAIVALALIYVVIFILGRTYFQFQKT